MKFEDWGLIDYESSVRRQLEYVEKTAAAGEDFLIFCTHPPVVTLGRGTEPSDLEGWSGTLIESARGGRATYHGPSQLVIYPILNLKDEKRVFAARDIHAYLRALENATVAVLHEFGLAAAESRTSRVGEVSLTGVWVGEHKLASIGIAVRKWVSYHGVAINVSADAQAFRGIRPCGFQASVMSSVEAELGRPAARAEFAALARGVFTRALGH